MARNYRPSLLLSPSSTTDVEDNDVEYVSLISKPKSARLFLRNRTKKHVSPTKQHQQQRHSQNNARFKLPMLQQTHAHQSPTLLQFPNLHQQQPSAAATVTTSPIKYPNSSLFRQRHTSSLSPTKMLSKTFTLFDHQIRSNIVHNALMATTNPDGNPDPELGATFELKSLSLVNIHSHTNEMEQQQQFKSFQRKSDEVQAELENLDISNYSHRNHIDTLSSLNNIRRVKDIGPTHADKGMDTASNICDNQRGIHDPKDDGKVIDDVSDCESSYETDEADATDDVESRMTHTETESELDNDLEIGVEMEMVQDAFARLRKEGVRVIPIEELEFGQDLDRGSFGMVREARWLPKGSRQSVPVAVKTGIRPDDLDENLEFFELEAVMAWKAANYNTRARLAASSSTVGTVSSEFENRAETHIMGTYGVSYECSWDHEPQLHLVMERLKCNGDIHNEIHSEANWVCLRDRGVDTGAQSRHQFVMMDGNDVWAYTMKRITKLQISLGLARAMRELADSAVLHCDIKPANTVLHRLSSQLKSHDEGNRILKLIDFGEANVLPDAKGDVAGTPGYMAPEMEELGDASTAADMYSAGVYLIELWVGWIGPLFDAYHGLETVDSHGLRAMRLEIANALSRLERVEPVIAGTLRKCVAISPENRPSALVGN